MASSPKKPDALILWWRPHNLRTSRLQGIQFGEKHTGLWGMHRSPHLPPSAVFCKTALEKSAEFTKSIQGYERGGIIAKRKEGREGGREGGRQGRQKT